MGTVCGMKNFTETCVDKNFILYLKKITLSLFIGFLLLTSFIFPINAYADNQDPVTQQKAREFIESFSKRAISILNNRDLTEAQYFEEYRSILNETFAINYLARISLSRHRKKASKEELAEYYSLFPDFILKVNSSRLRKLDTTKIVIEKVTPHAKLDIFIRTKAYNSENKSLDIDWRVRSDKDGNIKIIDVKIEGISMVATQRDDFTARISTSGIDGLNKYMQNIIDGIKFAKVNVTPRT